MAVTPDCAGGWLATADGGVFSAEGTAFYGSAGNLPLDAPVVGIAASPDDKGYWLAAADGGVFSFGDATYYGSMGGKALNSGIVGMAATPDGNGYWLVAADGGVFSFGDATYYGSMGGDRLAAPITAMAVASSGKGYWIVAADGGVFTFGDAGFYGSLASPSLGSGGSNGTNVIANPIVSLVPTSSDQGYLLLPAAPGVNPRVPGDTGFASAKREWQLSSNEAAVNQSVTWEQAASYLAIGERSDPGNRSGYPAAIAELNQLALIPEMDVTPAQDTEASADTAALTSFFDATL